MAERMAKYTTIVHPRNLHSGYGKGVVVYAHSAQEAINRAVDIGWNGRSEYARVKITSVEDVQPVSCPCVHQADVSETGAERA